MISCNQRCPRCEKKIVGDPADHMCGLIRVPISTSRKRITGNEYDIPDVFEHLTYVTMLLNLPDYPWSYYDNKEVDVNVDSPALNIKVRVLSFIH